MRAHPDRVVAGVCLQRVCLQRVCLCVCVCTACILLGVPGRVLPSVLENSVSQYPKTEGRFLQVAGITFAFNPNKPAGKCSLAWCL